MKNHVLTPDQIEYMREKCRTDLVFLCTILGFYDLAPIHRKMADFICSPAIRKVLCGFRSSFKSVIGAVARSIQKAIQPDGARRRILLVYNNDNNAGRKLRIIKNIFEGNQLFRTLFPEILPSNYKAVKWSEHELDIAGKDPSIDAATFTAMGVGGQAVSGHYTDLILDDIVAPSIDDMTGEEILPNREEVDKAIGWFRLCDSLLIKQKEQEIMVLCNRWFPQDHYDFITKLNDTLPEHYRYQLMSLPIIENGVPTFPEWYGHDEIESLRASKGSFIFAAQYLNSPTSAERQVFRPEHFNRYDKLPDGLKIYMTLDRAGGWTKKADYTVLFVGGISKDRELYAIHYDRGHFSAMETIKRLLRLNEMYNPIQIGVEKDMLGEQLNEFLSDLRKETGVSPPIRMLQCRKQAKVSRIQALQPFFEAGKAFFRKNMGELETELLEFSLDESHRHDDILDCWAYFLKMATPPIEYTVPKRHIHPNPFSYETVLTELGILNPRPKLNPAIHTFVPTGTR